MELPQPLNSETSRANWPPAALAPRRTVNPQSRDQDHRGTAGTAPKLLGGLVEDVVERRGPTMTLARARPRDPAHRLNASRKGEELGAVHQRDGHTAPIAAPECRRAHLDTRASIGQARDHALGERTRLGGRLGVHGTRGIREDQDAIEGELFVRGKAQRLQGHRLALSWRRRTRGDQQVQQGGKAECENTSM